MTEFQWLFWGKIRDVFPCATGCLVAQEPLLESEWPKKRVLVVDGQTHWCWCYNKSKSHILSGNPSQNKLIQIIKDHSSQDVCLCIKLHTQGNKQACFLVERLWLLIVQRVNENPQCRVAASVKRDQTAMTMMIESDGHNVIFLVVTMMLTSWHQLLRQKTIVLLEKHSSSVRISMDLKAFHCCDRCQRFEISTRKVNKPRSEITTKTLQCLEIWKHDKSDVQQRHLFHNECVMEAILKYERIEPTALIENVITANANNDNVDNIDNTNIDKVVPTPSPPQPQQPGSKMLIVKAKQFGLSCNNSQGRIESRTN